jgi:hypothetical protein
MFLFVRIVVLLQVDVGICISLAVLATSDIHIDLLDT